MRFVKQGKIRFTSHRDVARMWERAFRRAELPLAYSSGFSPRPKVSFGLALPTGAESDAEYLDIELDPVRLADGFDPLELPARLSPVLPVGIDVTAVALVEAGADSLQHQITSCRWELAVTGVTEDELRNLVSEALAAEALVIPRERKGQTSEDDVRPAILSAAVIEPVDGYPTLACVLATQPRTLRPAELLAALAGGVEEVRVRRTHQWITSRDGAPREPLPVDATNAPSVPTLERVS